MNASTVVATESTPFAVRLKKVGKAYPLSGPSGKLLRLPWTKRPEPEVFHALKDISFEIKAGRSIGVLGLNGAGKSTLLSIIAGNLRATSGDVEVNGRVQYLQLSGGFTPELSARQNVVGYARARGLPSSEIERRVAYVEEFADIGQFFDQPMQTYSSGMRGRVAFGNAFAVDPEILIVDEALAVGDAVFVNKCFRRLNEARSRGTTFIYTSHSMDSVVRLCDEAVVLHKGEVYFMGGAKESAEHYSALLHGTYFEDEGETTSGSDVTPGIAEVERKPSAVEGRSANPETFQFAETDDVDRSQECAVYNTRESIRGGGGARIVGCAVFRNGKIAESVNFNRGDKIEIFARVYFSEKADRPNFGFILSPLSGECFYGTNQEWLNVESKPAARGESRVYRLSFQINVAPGPWFVDLAIANPNPPLQKRNSMLHFVVQPTPRKSAGPGWLNLAIEG